MTTLSTKSTDGRTEWILEEGRLKEIGPQSPAFTLRAENTFILLKLLLQGKNDVLCAVQQERSVSQEDVLIVRGENVSEQGSHAQSSIEIAPELRGTGHTIKPNRDA